MRDSAHPCGAGEGELGDTDGNGLPHATHSETSERWIPLASFNKCGPAENKLGGTRVAGLDDRRGLLRRLSTLPIDLLTRLQNLQAT